MDREALVIRGVAALIVVLLGWMIFYYVYHSGLQGRECAAANARGLDGSLRGVSASDAACGYALRDYYILSAANACSGGAARNDYVNVCNLKSVLRQGCRGIDLEIYNVGGKPVVSTGGGSNYFVKDTLNFVSFDDVMSVLKNYGFSAATAPNATDPILLHLRIKSNDPLVYSSMVSTFKAHSSSLLGKEYSFEFEGKNLGAVPLLQLCGKIVVVVDRKDPVFVSNQEFMEYVNMTSSSVMMRALPYRDVVGTPDLGELQTYNKQHMTICTPGDSSANPSGIVLREAGVQLQCFAWQLEDQSQAEANAFFDATGYAFVLKPERLRYVETTVPTPTAQNPAVNYAPKTVTAPYYKFEM